MKTAPRAGWDAPLKAVRLFGEDVLPVSDDIDQEFEEGAWL